VYIPVTHPRFRLLPLGALYLPWSWVPLRLPAFTDLLLHVWIPQTDSRFPHTTACSCVLLDCYLPNLGGPRFCTYPTPLAVSAVTAMEVNWHYYAVFYRDHVTQRTLPLPPRFTGTALPLLFTDDHCCLDYQVVETVPAVTGDTVTITPYSVIAEPHSLPGLVGDWMPLPHRWCHYRVSTHPIGRLMLFVGTFVIPSVMEGGIHLLTPITPRTR